MTLPVDRSISAMARTELLDGNHRRESAAPPPAMDVADVARAVVQMASLGPERPNVQFNDHCMATKMPLSPRLGPCGPLLFAQIIIAQPIAARSTLRGLILPQHEERKKADAPQPARNGPVPAATAQ